MLLYKIVWTQRMLKVDTYEYVLDYDNLNVAERTAVDILYSSPDFRDQFKEQGNNLVYMPNYQKKLLTGASKYMLDHDWEQKVIYDENGEYMGTVEVPSNGYDNDISGKIHQFGYKAFSGAYKIVDGILGFETLKDGMKKVVQGLGGSGEGIDNLYYDFIKSSADISVRDIEHATTGTQIAAGAGELATYLAAAFYTGGRSLKQLQGIGRLRTEKYRRFNDIMTYNPKNASAQLTKEMRTLRSGNWSVSNTGHKGLDRIVTALPRQVGRVADAAYKRSLQGAPSGRLANMFFKVEAGSIINEGALSYSAPDEYSLFQMGLIDSLFELGGMDSDAKLTYEHSNRLGKLVADIGTAEGLSLLFDNVLAGVRFFSNKVAGRGGKSFKLGLDGELQKLTKEKYNFGTGFNPDWRRFTAMMADDLDQLDSWYYQQIATQGRKNVAGIVDATVDKGFKQMGTDLKQAKNIEKADDAARRVGKEVTPRDPSSIAFGSFIADMNDMLHQTERSYRYALERYDELLTGTARPAEELTKEASGIHDYLLTNVAKGINETLDQTKDPLKHRFKMMDMLSIMTPASKTLKTVDGDGLERTVMPLSEAKRISAKKESNTMVVAFDAFKNDYGVVEVMPNSWTYKMRNKLMEDLFNSEKFDVDGWTSLRFPDVEASTKEGAEQIERAGDEWSQIYGQKVFVGSAEEGAEGTEFTIIGANKEGLVVTDFNEVTVIPKKNLLLEEPEIGGLNVRDLSLEDLETRKIYTDLVEEAEGDIKKIENMLSKEIDATKKKAEVAKKKAEVEAESKETTESVMGIPDEDTVAKVALETDEVHQKFGVVQNFFNDIAKRAGYKSPRKSSVRSWLGWLGAGPNTNYDMLSKTKKGVREFLKKKGTKGKGSKGIDEGVIVKSQSIDGDWEHFMVTQKTGNDDLPSVWISDGGAIRLNPYYKRVDQNVTVRPDGTLQQYKKEVTDVRGKPRDVYVPVEEGEKGVYLNIQKPTINENVSQGEIRRRGIDGWEVTTQDGRKGYIPIIEAEQVVDPTKMKGKGGFNRILDIQSVKINTEATAKKAKEAKKKLKKGVKKAHETEKAKRQRHAKGQVEARKQNLKKKPLSKRKVRATEQDNKGKAYNPEATIEENIGTKASVEFDGRKLKERVIKYDDEGPYVTISKIRKPIEKMEDGTLKVVTEVEKVPDDVPFGEARMKYKMEGRGEVLDEYNTMVDDAFDQVGTPVKTGRGSYVYAREDGNLFQLENVARGSEGSKWKIGLMDKGYTDRTFRTRKEAMDFIESKADVSKGGKLSTDIKNYGEEQVIKLTKTDWGYKYVHPDKSEFEIMGEGRNWSVFDESGTELFTGNTRKDVVLQIQEHVGVSSKPMTAQEKAALETASTAKMSGLFKQIDPDDAAFEKRVDTVVKQADADMDDSLTEAGKQAKKDIEDELGGSLMMKVPLGGVARYVVASRVADAFIDDEDSDLPMLIGAMAAAFGRVKYAKKLSGFIQGRKGFKAHEANPFKESAEHMEIDAKLRDPNYERLKAWGGDNIEPMEDVAEHATIRNLAEDNFSMLQSAKNWLKTTPEQVSQMTKKLRNNKYVQSIDQTLASLKSETAGKYLDFLYGINKRVHGLFNEFNIAFTDNVYNRKLMENIAQGMDEATAKQQALEFSQGITDRFEQEIGVELLRPLIEKMYTGFDQIGRTSQENTLKDEFGKAVARVMHSGATKAEDLTLEGIENAMPRNVYKEFPVLLDVDKKLMQDPMFQDYIASQRQWFEKSAYQQYANLTNQHLTEWIRRGKNTKDSSRMLAFNLFEKLKDSNLTWSKFRKTLSDEEEMAFDTYINKDREFRRAMKMYHKFNGMTDLRGRYYPQAINVEKIKNEKEKIVERLAREQEQLPPEQQVSREHLENRAEQEITDRIINLNYDVDQLKRQAVMTDENGEITTRVFKDQGEAMVYLEGAIDAAGPRTERNLALEELKQTGEYSKFVKKKFLPNTDKEVFYIEIDDPNFQDVIRPEYNRARQNLYTQVTTPIEVSESGFLENRRTRMMPLEFVETDVERLRTNYSFDVGKRLHGLENGIYDDIDAERVFIQNIEAEAGLAKNSETSKRLRNMYNVMFNTHGKSKEEMEKYYSSGKLADFLTKAYLSVYGYGFHLYNMFEPFVVSPMINSWGSMRKSIPMMRGGTQLNVNMQQFVKDIGAIRQSIESIRPELQVFNAGGDLKSSINRSRYGVNRMADWVTKASLRNAVGISAPKGYGNLMPVIGGSFMEGNIFATALNGHTSLMEASNLASIAKELLDMDVAEGGVRNLKKNGQVWTLPQVEQKLRLLGVSDTETFVSKFDQFKAGLDAMENSKNFTQEFYEANPDMYKTISNIVTTATETYHGTSRATRPEKWSTPWGKTVVMFQNYANNFAVQHLKKRMIRPMQDFTEKFGTFSEQGINMLDIATYSRTGNPAKLLAKGMSKEAVEELPLRSLTQFGKMFSALGVSIVGYMGLDAVKDVMSYPVNSVTDQEQWQRLNKNKFVNPYAPAEDQITWGELFGGDVGALDGALKTAGYFLGSAARTGYFGKYGDTYNQRRTIGYKGLAGLTPITSDLDGLARWIATSQLDGDILKGTHDATWEVIDKLPILGSSLFSDVRRNTKSYLTEQWFKEASTNPNMSFDIDLPGLDMSDPFESFNDIEF